jgi:hypothetical protein
MAGIIGPETGADSLYSPNKNLNCCFNGALNHSILRLGKFLVFVPANRSRYSAGPCQL